MLFKHKRQELGVPNLRVSSISGSGIHLVCDLSLCQLTELENEGLNYPRVLKYFVHVHLPSLAIAF